MDVQPRFSALALRPVRDPHLVDGAWWPSSRTLVDQIARLLALWPVDASLIVQARYARPDWDDGPDSVSVDGWRVLTAPFPDDRPRLLLLSLLNHQRRTLLVIPPATRIESARRILLAVSRPTPQGPSLLGGRDRPISTTIPQGRHPAPVRRRGRASPSA